LPNGVSLSFPIDVPEPCPSTTFHSVFTGMERGFLSKPGNFIYNWANATTVAFVKLSVIDLPDLERQDAGFSHLEEVVSRVLRHVLLRLPRMAVD